MIREIKNCVQKLNHKAKLIFPIATILFLVTLFVLPSALVIRSDKGETAPPAINNAATVETTIPACTTDATVLAEYQAWHGLSSHYAPPPYLSTDPDVITRHIISAQARCIDGYVVNWYGPPGGMPNDEDREFIDQAFAELLKQAEQYDFEVGILYDEGTLYGSAPITNTRVISDLLYATKYFTSSAYLTINENPALFVFPYENIDPDIDWQDVRQQLPTTITLIDKDPNPGDLSHDNLFDGFYAWVQPSGSGWLADGTEWGEGYLRWFYPTMATTYSDKVVIGGVWPGFDDTLASWGSGRYMWRRCGQTWYDTWDIANEFNPAYIMIATWNDFEEGTDIEYGIGECLSPGQTKYSGPGAQVEYTHLLTNTGKFTDTFTVSASSSRGWPTAINDNNIELPGYESVVLPITLTVPSGLSSCGQDALQITATSTISASVTNGSVDTTIIPCIYLPVVIKPLWQENFDPIQQNWSEVSASWIDVAGPTAVLRENNPGADFGKVETGMITLDTDTYPILRIKSTAVNPNSSYTVQIDNTDGLVGITSPGEHTLNIANLMNWQGVHSFTINLWISGEGQSITFDYIGFEKK